MRLIHLIGVIQDNFFVAACGKEEHWDHEPSELRTAGILNEVTCKACRRTNTFKNQSAGFFKPIYGSHRRN